ncbi:MAG: hypothetical protein ACUVUE_00550 [Candidatus Bathycorpusculaceae bacterium]
MSRSAELRHLGSYKELNAKACLDKKLDTLVEDEFGLPKPLSISLVIPTKIDATKETRDVELNVLRNVMSECSKLVDLGYIDEIVVIDGSLNEKGEANFEVLERVVETAYDQLDLFKRQARLINENKAQALMARRGFFDFIVKAVHQFDPNIFSALKRLELSAITGLSNIPMGKGAALWLSVPLAAGDVVCYMDSDIMNFTKEFVIALCHPIISSWRDSASQFKVVKACYRRLTVSLEPLGNKYFFGGRVTRLFAIPMLRVLSREYPKIFGGLDFLDYPLSGEFAVQKELLEKISFPNDYSIEFSVLRHATKLTGVSQLAQVDLNFFHHIGQSAENLGKMVGQIASYIIKTLKEEGVELSESAWKKILDEYEGEVEELLDEYEKVFIEQIRDLAQDLKVKLAYSKNTEIEISKKFRQILDETFIKASLKEQIVLSSWANLDEKTKYLAVSTVLRRRGNQSTFSRLKDTGLFYGL